MSGVSPEERKAKELDEVGRNTLAALREMVAALECDYDRLEELQDLHQEYIDDKAETNWLEDYPQFVEELAELEAAAGDCKSREDAEQRIHEDPLSIEYRSGWVTDKSELQQAEEARILLCTGGPAAQIIVELAEGEPRRAYLQVQDWGTPWTDYYEPGIGEVLMTYVRCFCFE